MRACVVGVHAGAGVADRAARRSARRRLRRDSRRRRRSSVTLRVSMRQRAAVGHRVAGVDRPGSSAPARSARDRPSPARARRRPAASTRMSSPIRRRSIGSMSRDHRVEVEDLQVEDLPAAEREQLARRARRRAARPSAISSRSGREPLRPAAASSSSSSREADDHRQQVVEVVRHAAGEPADASIFCACRSCSRGAGAR